MRPPIPMPSTHVQEALGVRHERQNFGAEATQSAIKPAEQASRATMNAARFAICSCRARAAAAAFGEELRQRLARWFDTVR